MIGAIIGDIIGSRFEFHNTHSRDFELFTEESTFTDDTVCTIATMDWMNRGSKDDYAEILAKWILAYPHVGFSPNMIRWAMSPTHAPYGSKGNGAPMRVSPIGWNATCEGYSKIMAKKVTEVSHNTAEALTGAQIIADCIYLSRFGYDKSYIKEYLERESSLNFNMTLELVVQKEFSALSPETVIASVVCFLQSNSFIDAIRNAVSLGGDSDTIASMTGAIADAYYGTPKELEDEAMKRLPKEFQEVILLFKQNIEKSWKEFTTFYMGVPRLIAERKKNRN